MWQAIGSVSGVLSLAAFCVAVLASIRKRRDLRDERLIRLAPPENRPELVGLLLDRLGVNVRTGDLPNAERYALALKALESDREDARRRFVLLVGAGLLLAIFSLLGFLRAEAGDYIVGIRAYAPNELRLDGNEYDVTGAGEDRRLEYGWEFVVPASKRGQSEDYVASHDEYQRSSCHADFGELREIPCLIFFAKPFEIFSGQVPGDSDIGPMIVEANHSTAIEKVPALPLSTGAGDVVSRIGDTEIDSDDLTAVGVRYNISVAFDRRSVGLQLEWFAQELNRDGSPRDTRFTSRKDYKIFGVDEEGCNQCEVKEVLGLKMTDSLTTTLRGELRGLVPLPTFGSLTEVRVRVDERGRQDDRVQEFHARLAEFQVVVGPTSEGMGG